VIGDDGTVVAGATGSKREEIKASRSESPGFDHGDLPPLDEQRRMIAETRRKFNEWLSGELGKARDHRG
jgi:N-methylhydantoinase B